MGELGTINIPYWLVDSLSARDVHCEVVLDYAALRTYFSYEDCVELLVSQRVNFPVFKSEDLGSGVWVLADEWVNTLGSESRQDLERIIQEAERRIDESLSTGRSTSVENRLQDLASADTIQSEVGIPAINKVDIISGIKGQKCFVVLGEGIVRLSVPEYYDLTERIIETYYTFGAAARAYRTPVMRTYMRMMSKVEV